MSRRTELNGPEVSGISLLSERVIAGSDAIILSNRRDGCIVPWIADDVDERLLGSTSNVFLLLVLVSASPELNGPDMAIEASGISLLSHRLERDIAGSDAIILSNRRDCCIVLRTADDIDELLFGSPSNFLLFLVLVSALSL